MEFYTLYNRLIPVIGKRGVWLFCHSISKGNACLICTTYFRRALITDAPMQAKGRIGRSGPSFRNVQPRAA
jgi:hypothetical protein